ncbi:conjugal transfer protein [Euzebya tangerina]|uniref:conjugal transfer protein n=1 Tax=Euzebya tangerina TaxID=591198 RepID=UPI0013C300E6|nr:conjugal transfer protein [Euzebya tangerina]
MSSSDTRPPLFDPQPPDRPSPRSTKDSSGGFSRNKKQRSSRRPSPGDSGGDSPKWVRPFILGGLLLVAVVSLVSIFGSGGEPESDGAVTSDQQADGADVPAVAGDSAEDLTASGAVVAESADAGGPDASDASAESGASADTDAAADTDVVGSGTAEAGPTEDLTRIEAFAVEFAFDYLNFQADQAAIREARLAAYLAPGLDPQLGWDGEGAQAAVLTMPVQTTLTDRGATVVVASQVTGPDASQWIHLAVPVAEDASGRLAVTAAPAYVPRPAAGEPEPPDVALDDDLGEELSGRMTPLFDAFADRAVVNEDGITAPDARIRGLDGDVSLVSVGELRVLEGDSTTRDARINVTWLRETAGSELTQSYVLTLVSDGDDWLVQQISTG